MTMQDKKFKSTIDKYFTRLKAWPPALRISMAVLLIIMGFFGFLPIIGFWMIPLGLMLLAIDFRWAKRLNTRVKYQFRKISNWARKKFFPKRCR